MKKVFYSVDYMIWGSDKPHRMWFENLEEAKEFAKSDYRDNPVKHVYSSKATIKMVEDLIELQKTELGGTRRPQHERKYNYDVY